MKYSFAIFSLGLLAISAPLAAAAGDANHNTTRSNKAGVMAGPASANGGDTGKPGGFEYRRLHSDEQVELDVNDIDPCGESLNGCGGISAGGTSAGNDGAGQGAGGQGAGGQGAGGQGRATDYNSSRSNRTTSNSAEFDQDDPDGSGNDTVDAAMEHEAAHVVQQRSGPAQTP